MGHKGVSKGNSSQKKAKSPPVEPAIGSISALIKATEIQPGKSQKIGGVISAPKAGVIPSSGGKKKSKKG